MSLQLRREVIDFKWKVLSLVIYMCCGLSFDIFSNLFEGVLLKYSAREIYNPDRSYQPV